jgi:CHAT domain-containing protein
MKRPTCSTPSDPAAFTAVGQRTAIAWLRALSAAACLWATISPAQAQPAPPPLPESVRIALEQATQAREAGDPQRERSVLEQAIAREGATSPATWSLYQMLSTSHADYGNLAKAAELNEAQLATARFPGQEVLTIVKAVALYSHLNQKDKAQNYLDRLERLQPRLRSAPSWPRQGDNWQAGTAWAQAQFHSARGHPDQADPAFRACLGASEAQLRKAPDDPGALFYLVDCTSGLMSNLIVTGQLAAAGQLADQQRSAVERVAQVSRRPVIATRVAGNLGRLAVEQGRPQEAKDIFQSALRAIEAAPGSDSSLRAANFRLQLAQVEMLQGHWEQALEWHRQREQSLQRAGNDRGNRGTQSLEYGYTLLRLGQAQEAVTMLRQILTIRERLYDENSLYLWEGRAFLGIALAGLGERDEALRLLRRAVPRILDIVKGERSSSEAGVLRTARLNWLLDGYIHLLAQAAQAGDAEASDEAFRMADLARGSTVQRALAAASSRANVSDPALAELARQEQDLQREISGLSEAIGNLLSRGRIAEQDQIVTDMRASLKALRDRHARTQAEIEKRFPDYWALLNPKPVGVGSFQKLLRPGESALSVYVGSQRTLVWAIPASGRVAFATVALTEEQLDQQVRAMRTALDPNAEAAGQLPRFPFDVAHGLYRALLAPVEAGWKGARELIVIPHGSLGQLPLGVLTTDSFNAAQARLPYAEMAEAPWLLRQLAISQLPAAVALPALRTSTARPAPRAFVGFGDPVFTATATGSAAATRGAGTWQRRNLALAPTAAAANPFPSAAPAINFKLLQPLPDTALEVEEVAAVLAADKERDVFLQHNASEARVKRADLSPYRVVMFATHGLMNGEMPGLYQPALALSNPALTGDGEDGMLTMEEILGLKLNADWVVLSACNSAAAGGQSTESVSGLGRAFFYAGAKALLVTNWAVETESARMLTTELFRRRAGDPALSRARALQQSSLELMKRSAGQDYSYAHPMFWAPYSIVGDGG